MTTSGISNPALLADESGVDTSLRPKRLDDFVGQSGLREILRIALEAAQAGYLVVLVEKEAQLGGWLRKFSRLFPKKPPYRELQPVDLQSRIEKIEQNDRIQVYQDATVEKISGQPGQFDVSVRANGTSTQFRAGAIIQATGWKPYDASRLGHLGYGSCANVITNVQMEELTAAGKITRPGDGKPARRIAFIQCAGSRDKENHLEYCSKICCMYTAKHALLYKHRVHDGEPIIFYIDVRTSGKVYEEFYN